MQSKPWRHGVRIVAAASSATGLNQGTRPFAVPTVPENPEYQVWRIERRSEAAYQRSNLGRLRRCPAALPPHDGRTEAECSMRADDPNAVFDHEHTAAHLPERPVEVVLGITEVLIQPEQAHRFGGPDDAARRRERKARRLP